MNATTLCPTCNTRFKVTQEQLDAHQGLVRCGRCQAVFNATEYLQDDQPSPQLDLIAAPQAGGRAPAETLIETPVEPSAEPAPATHAEPGFSLFEALRAEAQEAEPQATAWSYTEPQQAEPKVDSEPAESVMLADEITVAESPTLLLPEPVKNKKKRTWPWIAGSVLLLILLLAQTTYFFRVELAAKQPGLKPTLVSYCSLLHCTVPLPQKADLMSIESSDLEADPAQASVIDLNALLRNHASYTQAYPQLELTLTDAQDKPLARRTFHPSEYLKAGEDETQGLAANRELSIKLNIDTTDLKPSGYRLFLFYPQ